MRLKTLIFLFPGLLAGFHNGLAQTERPRLVVGIVVDQMRWDYLYRYEKLYAADGFERLLHDGFNCQQTFINYLPSFTAAGHACIYTGSVPAFNGIVANDWFDRNSGRAWYCTEDTVAQAVGGSDESGRMSPRNLLATTITDELRLATNFRSKVIGLSIKDRGAILPAGHTANAAYWYDSNTGNFMTSDYYRKALPPWLTAFNQRQIGDSLMRQGWRMLLPVNAYQQSTADDNSYEGRFSWEERPVFPHNTDTAENRNDKGAIRYTPFANTLLRQLAESCIQGEALGKDSTTDFLTVSFSATDYVGHLFGPNAIETEDTYLRLDRDLAQFLRFLDKTVGQGNYLIFLTADHGAAHNALFMQDHHIPAQSVSIKEIKQELNQFLSARYQDSGLVQSLYNYQVFLNNKAIAEKKVDRQALLSDIQSWLEDQHGVTAVYNLENGDVRRAPEAILDMIKNGYYRRRCGSLQIIMDPQWYSGYGRTGATHGSWNPYDTHIPLIWYGWHIHKGETFDRVNMTDIAATLAVMLHIQMPSACVGKVILPLLSSAPDEK
ncbi:MAG TPA: alkaline phosphatase PafA [Edaphocola sp.]|nr:alkaline phosphatase PafA [Edaphocola sp.]